MASISRDHYNYASKQAGYYPESKRSCNKFDHERIGAVPRRPVDERAFTSLRRPVPSRHVLDVVSNDVV